MGIRLISMKKIIVVFSVIALLLNVACKSSEKVKSVKVENNKDKKITLTLFFPDKDLKKLVKEERKVSITDKIYSETVINELLKGNKDGDKFFPDNTKLLNTKQEGTRVNVNFSKEFLNGDVKKNLNDSLIIYAIVNSLTQSDSIKSVQILIDGKNVDYFRNFNISKPLESNTDVSNTSGVLNSDSTIITKLYFPDPNKTSYEFATENRKIVVKDKAVAKAIINELINGSQKYGSLIPKGTKLLSVNIKDSTSYVNFSTEFDKNNNLGSGYETMMIYSIVNSLTEISSIKKVIILVNGSTERSNTHMDFDEPLVRNLNPIKDSNDTGNVDDSNLESTIKAQANKVLEAVKTKNMDTLATYIHPQKGVRFTIYSHIDLANDKVFTSNEVKTLMTNSQKYKFGIADGSGTDILLTFKDFYSKYLYDKDYINATNVKYNQIIGTGNTKNNIYEAYPSCNFVEYHFPSFDKKYEGMDWESIRIVFEKYNGKWYLVGLIHDQWTI